MLATAQLLEILTWCWRWHQPCPPSLGAYTKPWSQPAPRGGLCGSLPFSSLCRRGWSQLQLPGMGSTKEHPEQPASPVLRSRMGLLKKKHSTSAFGRSSHGWRCSKERKSPVQPQQCNCPLEMSRLVLPSASLIPHAPGFPSPSPVTLGQDWGKFAGILLLFASFKGLQMDPVTWL